MATKTIISWTCCGDEVFDQPEIIKHLVSVHGLQKPIHSIKSMVMALDGPGWSLNTYEHKIGDLVLHQTIKTEGEDGHASQVKAEGHP